MPPATSGNFKTDTNRISLSETQLSLLRSGKVRGKVRGLILKCPPADLISYDLDDADLNSSDVD